MITNEKFEAIKTQLLKKLTLHLPKELYYHGVHHTLDVLEQAERIAGEENVTNELDLQLLRLACLYHDSGFLETRQMHEEASCELARKDLLKYGVSDENIDWICGMILATKIPQIPLNQMERIICDADLDYLGREDFFEISQNLFHELKEFGIVSSIGEWNQVQVNFFKQHMYFTKTNKLLRGPVKSKHLAIIEASI